MAAPLPPRRHCRFEASTRRANALAYGRDLLKVKRTWRVGKSKAFAGWPKDLEASSSSWDLAIRGRWSETVGKRGRDSNQFYKRLICLGSDRPAFFRYLGIYPGKAQKLFRLKTVACQLSSTECTVFEPTIQSKFATTANGRIADQTTVPEGHGEQSIAVGADSGHSRHPPPNEQD